MLDYLDVESEYSVEEVLVRDTAREFVAEKVRPDVADHFEAGTFPADLVEKMGDLDFYAPNIDHETTAGVSERAYGLLMSELEAGDSGGRSMASVQGALVMYPTTPAAPSPGASGGFPTSPTGATRPRRRTATATDSRGQKPGSRTRPSRTWRWSGRETAPRKATRSGGFSSRPTGTA